MDQEKFVEDSLLKTCLGRQYNFKCFEGCLPQILIGPFLNTLTQIQKDSTTKHFLKRYKMMLKDFWAHQFPFQCEYFTESEVERIMLRFYVVRYAPIRKSISSRVADSRTAGLVKVHSRTGCPVNFAQSSISFYETSKLLLTQNGKDPS